MEGSWSERFRCRRERRPFGRFLEADDGPADACVALDGWMKRRNRPELVVATRGLVALDLDVQTGERDLHSGHYGGTALNAIHALAQALTALFPRDGRLPEPLRAGVTAPSDDELAGWGDLPAGAEELERVGAVPLDARAAEDFYVRAFVEPSVDVTGIPLVVRAGGTLPVLAALARRRIPMVMTGLALPDSHTHSPNERMLVETFPLGVAAARETYLGLGAL